MLTTDLHIIYSRYCTSYSCLIKSCSHW